MLQTGVVGRACPAALALALVACDDPGKIGGVCQTDEECPSGEVCQMGQCQGVGTTSDGEPSTGAMSSGPTGTGPDAGWNTCTPDNAPFVSGDDMILRCFLVFDPRVHSCAALSEDSGGRQMLFEVSAATGLVDLTAFGVVLEASSRGRRLPDPFQGDSQVLELPYETHMTLTGTIIEGGTPISIMFRIDEAGPALSESAVAFE